MPPTFSRQWLSPNSRRHLKTSLQKSIRFHLPNGSSRTDPKKRRPTKGRQRQPTLDRHNGLQKDHPRPANSRATFENLIPASIANSALTLPTASAGNTSSGVITIEFTPSSKRSGLSGIFPTTSGYRSARRASPKNNTIRTTTRLPISAVNILIPKKIAKSKSRLLIFMTGLR